MTVLDVSNYDYPTFDATCLKANGITGLIIGTQNPAIARNMCEGARQAGIPIIGLYGLDYFGTPGEFGDVKDAIQIAREYNVNRIWLDCEVDGIGTSPNLSPEDRNAEVREMVAAVRGAGLSPGIYTASWWWVPKHGNTTEFADLPLWFAAYGADSYPTGPIRTVGFGGWTDVAIHQYTSRFDVCGRERDANYVFEEVEDDMADPRVDAILALLTGLGPEAAMAAVNDFNTTDGQPNGNSLLLVVEQEKIKLGGLIQTVEAHTKAPHAGGLAPGTRFSAEVQ